MTKRFDYGIGDFVADKFGKVYNAIKEFKRLKGHIALIILVILFVLIPLLFQVKNNYI